MKRVIFIILAGIIFASCAPAAKNNIISRMSKTSERSDEYQHGFMDGCGSGLKSIGDANHMHFKDLKRYNGEYKLGWDDGLKRCSK